jgi:exosortase A
MNQAAASPTLSSTSPAWRIAVPALALTLLMILVLFRETALDMAAIWGRSDTYAHGMIVPPITLWLVWRVRSRIAVLAPRGSFLAVLLLAGAGFGWLLGELAAVNALSQFALTAMLIFAVPAVLGWTVARRIAFPLFFLLFAVPFGDFTQPKLMEWTAHATVFGLRLTGVPVFSEGQNLVIPSGSWSVVEACSGVRYLIASVTVGTLFRLSHLFLLEAATAVCQRFDHCADHRQLAACLHDRDARPFVRQQAGCRRRPSDLRLGILRRRDPGHVLDWGALAGGRAGRGTHVVVDESGVTVGGMPAVASVVVAAVVTVLVAALWPLVQRQIDQQTAQPVSQISPLEPIVGWHETREGLYDWSPRFENYAASTRMILEKDRKLAGLFVAYYRNQDQQHKLVTSSNVLVASDDPGVVESRRRHARNLLQPAAAQDSNDKSAGTRQHADGRLAVVLD